MPPATVLDIAALPSLKALGFTGGRDSFRAFCKTAFERDELRFLASDSGDLVVFRHADLKALAVLPEIGAVPPGVLFAGVPGPSPDGSPGLGQGIADVISNQVFTANPPIHGPVRRVLQAQLSPRQIALMEAPARAVIEGILASFADGDTIDLVQDVAEQLAVRFWGGLIGMTPDELTDAAHAVKGMTALFVLDRTLDDIVKADNSTRRYGELVEAAALRSLASGGNPMLNALAADLAAVDLPDAPATAGVVPPNVGKLLAGNLVDAFHTAALGAANVTYTLLRHSDVLPQIAADPALLGPAVMEALRLEPPVIFLNRFALGDVEYDGHIIRAGTSIAMMWGAGNHDPAAFSEPGHFRMTRSHQGLTTFGMGQHLCPGRSAAVMLAKVLIEGIAASGITFAFDEAASSWLGNLAMNQLKAMPLTVRRPAS